MLISKVYHWGENPMKEGVVYETFDGRRSQR